MNLERYPAGYLLLEDGSQFPGEALVGAAPVFGEVVFNTSASGYQEILTDPSYYHQILVFTSPHIGNVGVNSEDVESDRIQAAGAVIRNLSPRARNWRAQNDLLTWMETGRSAMLLDADTRALTQHVRQSGAMRAGFFTSDVPPTSALEQLRLSPLMVGADLASVVSCAKPYNYSPLEAITRWHPLSTAGAGLHVAVLDFGVKRNILQELACRGCAVTVFPGYTEVDEILAQNFDGVLLSNGPGDPAAVTYGIEAARKLLGKVSLFGICLGHQLLALAIGMQTFKLLFGHRGANHPVRRESDKTVEITSQNHGFAVAPEGLPNDWQITHINLNDGTVEGLRHKHLPIFSIQYHPEASPGPHDSLSYFDLFLHEMRHAQK